MVKEQSFSSFRKSFEKLSFCRGTSAVKAQALPWVCFCIGGTSREVSLPEKERPCGKGEGKKLLGVISL